MERQTNTTRNTEIIRKRLLIKLRKLKSVTKPHKYILEVLVNGFSSLRKLKIKSDSFDDILLKWLTHLKNTMETHDKELLYSFSNIIIVNFINIILLPKLDVNMLEKLICIWEDIMSFFPAFVIENVVNNNMALLVKIVEHMQIFGHYFHQLCSYITLYKYVHSCQNNKIEILKKLFPEEKYKICVSIMNSCNIATIDLDSRQFLNSFNEVQEYITVYSLIATNIKLDKLTVIPPKTQNKFLDLWVNFNIGTSSLFFQCDASSFHDNTKLVWLKFEIKPDNLESIYINEKNGFINLEISITGCICLDEDFVNFVHNIKNVEFNFHLRDVTFTKLQNIMKEYLSKINKLNKLNIGINPKGSKLNKLCLSVVYNDSKLELKKVIKPNNKNTDHVLKKRRNKISTQKPSASKIASDNFGEIHKKLSLLNPSLVDAEFFTDSYNLQELDDYYMHRINIDNKCFEAPTQKMNIELDKQNNILYSPLSNCILTNNFKDESNKEKVMSLHTSNFDASSCKSEYKRVSIPISINAKNIESDNLQKDVVIDLICRSPKSCNENGSDGELKNSAHNTTFTKLINRVKPLQNSIKGNNRDSVMSGDDITEMDSLEYIAVRPFYENEEQLEQAFNLYCKYKQNPDCIIKDSKINLIENMIEGTSHYFKTNNNTNNSKDVYDISNILSNNKNININKESDQINNSNKENLSLINFSYRRSKNSNIENLSIDSKTAMMHMKINTNDKKIETRKKNSNAAKGKKRNNTDKRTSVPEKMPRNMKSSKIELARHDDNAKSKNDIDEFDLFNSVYPLNDCLSVEPNKKPTKCGIKSKRLTKTYHKNAVPKVVIKKLITRNASDIDTGANINKLSVAIVNSEPEILKRNECDQEEKNNDFNCDVNELINNDCDMNKVNIENKCPAERKWIINKFFSNFSDFDNSNENENQMYCHSINSFGSSPIRAGQHISTNYTNICLDNLVPSAQPNPTTSILSNLESLKSKNNNNRENTFIVNESDYTINDKNYNKHLNNTNLCIENFISSDGIEKNLIPIEKDIEKEKNIGNKNVSLMCNDDKFTVDNNYINSNIDLDNKSMLKYTKPSINKHCDESLLLTSLKTDFEKMFCSFAKEKSDLYFGKTENMIETINKNIKNIIEKYFLKMKEVQKKVEKHKDIIQNLYEQLAHEQINYAELIKESIQCKNEIAKHLRAVKRMKTEILTMEKNNCYALEKDVLVKTEELKKLFWQIFITNVADEMKNYILCSFL